MFDPDLAGRLAKFVTVVRPVLETVASPDDLFLMTNFQFFFLQFLFYDLFPREKEELFSMNNEQCWQS